MKTFFLGILTIIFIQGLLNATDYYCLDHNLQNSRIQEYSFTALDYLNLTPVILIYTGRCQPVSRKYFKCNRVQTAISDLFFNKNQN